MEKKPIKSNITVFHKTWFLISDGTLQYRTLYLSLALLGIWYPGAFSFHLLDISMQSDLTRSVFQAVTTNGISILLTAVLGILLMYIYAVIGFFSFRDYYSATGLDCVTLFSCTVSTISKGIRTGGGIGDVLDPPDYLDGGVFWARQVFDITFWIIIIIIILNVVFGIILDTFGALRDERKDIEEEIKSKCFICNITANTFQQKALGFKHHIKHDHNIWKYLYFFVHLDLKDKDEYTAAEEYVQERNKAGDIVYFPINKAICLHKKKKKKKAKEEEEE